MGRQPAGGEVGISPPVTRPPMKSCTNCKKFEFSWERDERGDYPLFDCVYHRSGHEDVEGLVHWCRYANECDHYDEVEIDHEKEYKAMSATINDGPWLNIRSFSDAHVICRERVPDPTGSGRTLMCGGKVEPELQAYSGDKRLRCQRCGETTSSEYKR